MQHMQLRCSLDAAFNYPMIADYAYAERIKLFLHIDYYKLIRVLVWSGYLILVLLKQNDCNSTYRYVNTHNPQSIIAGPACHFAIMLAFARHNLAVEDFWILLAIASKISSKISII